MTTYFIYNKGLILMVKKDTATTDKETTEILEILEMLNELYNSD